MNAAELKSMPKAELEDRVQTLREEIFKLRFKATTEPVTDPAGLRRKRKEIARIRTVLRQQELEAGATPKIGRASRAYRMAKRQAVVNHADREALKGRRGRGKKG